ncbi:MAG TPA: amino acid ABC transporter substrate-binding protein [Oribacterium sp.]|nr:amino acid ABC transporter substrate-binding protein [Oribacterium sp.]
MKKSVFAAFTALVAAASLAACGASSTPDTTTAAASPAATTAAAEAAGETTTAAATEATSDTSAAASGNFRTLDDIKQSGTVKIGVFSDKAPFGYVDDKGEYQGYDVYYAHRIADDLGVNVEFTSLDPASRVEYVATGKVDIVLANFTVTPERAEQVDFALPYMKVALGVVSPDSAVISSVDELKDKTLIVAKGTTAETYFEKNYPEIKLQKYDAYADAYNALLDGRGDAFSTDNTEVIAWAKANPGFTVGIETLGDYDTIAAAVAKGNSTLLDFLNDEIETLGKENFFHKDYDETLKAVFGEDTNPDSMVVEGGVVE